MSIADFAEAKKTGKPLLVVLRCVPCLSCVGLDAEVLKEPSLAPLLDQFVCVRVINANTLDLSRFQFDYDLSFSTLIFNADGTLYGRYGSWTHQADPEARETIGYRRALEAALALHRGYPAKQASLAGKQGGPIPFKTPVEIPSLAVKYGRELNWGGNVVQSCVHCHQVGEAFRASYRERGKAGADGADLSDAGTRDDRAHARAGRSRARYGGRARFDRGDGRIPRG